MTRAAVVVAGGVLLAGALLGGCRRCEGGGVRDAGGPEVDGSAQDRAHRGGDGTGGADAVAESVAELAGAAAAARRLTEALLADGIAPREVSSVADIRGYRLYRQKRYGQALAWFDRGVRTDGSYEPCLFNAARAAAMSGDPARARRYLARLRRLDTPMARRQLAGAPADPALAALRRGR